MKLSGGKALEIELMKDNSVVQITLTYKTAYEASIAYDEITTAARSGKLKMTFGIGEVLEQEGDFLSL